MYAMVANDFSPVIRYVYNAGASVISQGMAVERAVALGAVQAPNPVGDNSPMRYVLGVVQNNPSITANAGYNFLGIAVESITTSTWGPICVGGPCQAVVSASTSFSDGIKALAFVTGYAIVPGSPYNAVPALTLPNGTASFTVAALGLFDCFIEPVRQPGGSGIKDK